MQAAIAKWGHSLALRLPRNVVANAGLAEGTPVTLTVEGESVVITKARPRYDLDELLAQMKPEHRTGEVDWGGAVGNEAW